MIDFWASWCSPCHNQLPYLDSIKKMMKNYPVNFISINVDEKLENWKSASKVEAKYLVSNNYYLSKQNKAAFVKAINLQSIPRYVVLEGTKVISIDFYQPTEPSFRKELISLVSKNSR